MSAERYTLVIPARAEYLLLARLALTGVARLADADEEALADLRLAVTEAAANACRHADEDGDGEITIELTLSFDDASVGEWNAADLGEDGMGLAIIHAVAENVEIGARENGSGTRLRFTRSLR